MEEKEILLRIRRHLSKSEKYRLLLRHIDAVETELATERKKNTDLMRVQAQHKQQINQLEQKLQTFQAKVKRLEAAQAPTPEEKQDRREFFTKYTEQVKKNIDLQNQINRLKQEGPAC